MLDINKLRAEQEKLAKKVITHDVFEEDEIKAIAGVDQAYTSDNRVISSIVVLDYKTKKEIESKYAVKEVSMPYIPGYLSYREAPCIADAYNLLENRPDMLFIDGNGILHPRRIGIASHVGILLDQITIGVAKSLLVGEVKDNRVIVDKEVRGYMLSTKEHANPVYISPGHKISIQTAVKLAKSLIIPPHKLPEPVHLAHKLANKIKKELAEKKGIKINLDETKTNPMQLND